MFDPQKHIKHLADDAYQAGRDCADALLKASAPINDEFLDQTRDALCGALLRVVKANGYFTPQVMLGVQASVSSGFEDRRRELQPHVSTADIPPEDIQATADAFEASQGKARTGAVTPRSVDTGLFEGSLNRRGENGRKQPRRNGRWIKMTWIDRP